MGTSRFFLATLMLAQFLVFSGVARASNCPQGPAMLSPGNATALIVEVTVLQQLPGDTPREGRAELQIDRIFQGEVASSTIFLRSTYTSALGGCGLQAASLELGSRWVMALGSQPDQSGAYGPWSFAGAGVLARITDDVVSGYLSDPGCYERPRNCRGAFGSMTIAEFAVAQQAYFSAALESLNYAQVVGPVFTLNDRRLRLPSIWVYTNGRQAYDRDGGLRLSSNFRLVDSGDGNLVFQLDDLQLR